jgi:hypothetical protein
MLFSNEPGFCEGLTHGMLHPYHWFTAGMLVSNEPGFYEDGAFGIRIENVVETVAADTPDRFGHEGSPYLTFNALTKVPMCSLLLDHALLEGSDVAWLDVYHAECREVLWPLLQAPADAVYGARFHHGVSRVRVRVIGG